MNQTIEIQAADVLFFRDGRPFTMGEDNYAGGIFPPLPSAFYGALRSAFIAEKFNNDVEQGITESAKLRLNHVFLTIQDLQYLPKPRDLVVPDSATNAIFLKRSSKPLYSNNQTDETLYYLSEGKTDDSDFLIETLAFERYLNGNDGSSFTLKKLSDAIEREFKLGIGRDNQTNSTDEGKLYRIGQNRLAKYVKNKKAETFNRLSFTLDFTGLEMNFENNFLALGGERRVAFVEKHDNKKAPLGIKRPELTSSCFKIYLATPAVFKEGWKPDSFLKKHGLTLLLAAVDRAKAIGGWDLESQRPKPMLQGVEAGSIYYVQAESVEKAEAFAELIHGSAISDIINGVDYAQQGFGIAYIGNL